MFRITFRVNVEGVEDTVTLGSMISQQEDPYKALDEGKTKRDEIASALRITMPQLRKIKGPDIEVCVSVHSPQLLLFPLPDQKRNEVLPGKRAYEMYLNDAAGTL